MWLYIFNFRKLVRTYFERSVAQYCFYDVIKGCLAEPKKNKIKPKDFEEPKREISPKKSVVDSKQKNTFICLLKSKSAYRL